MSLFTMDLAKLTFRDIEEFCAENFPESMRLDYKRELSATDPAKQVARIVSSFTNTQGGVAMFGVGTKPNSKYPDLPAQGFQADADFEKRVTRWCIEHIAPPVIPFIGYVEHPSNPARAFGVVRTEMSLLTPHTLEGGTRFYVRRADNSDPVDATLAEFELLRNRRQAALELEHRHFEDLQSRLRHEMREPLLRTHTVVPQFSSDDPVPWAQLLETARQFEEIGFREDVVRQVQPYSHGVISNQNKHWVFVLTARGGLGFAVTHGADASEPKEISIGSLLGWVQLGVRGSALLSQVAGYWGDYVARFTASGYKGLPLINERMERIFHSRGVSTCVDNEIVLEGRWTAHEARTGEIDVTTRFGRPPPRACHAPEPYCPLPWT